MKCSLGISNFLGEISSLSHSFVSLYFFALIVEEGFLISLWRRKRQPTPVFLPGESQGQGAWWAAVCGVAQSWTRLKPLSSSSSSSSSRIDWLDLLAFQGTLKSFSNTTVQKCSAFFMVQLSHPYVTWKIITLMIWTFVSKVTEKAIATHSSTLAWKMPWTKEPGRLESMGSQRVRHAWAT